MGYIKKEYQWKEVKNMSILVETYNLNLSYAGTCGDYYDPDCCVVSGDMCSFFFYW